MTIEIKFQQKQTKTNKADALNILDSHKASESNNIVKSKSWCTSIPPSQENIFNNIVCILMDA